MRFGKSLRAKSTDFIRTTLSLFFFLLLFPFAAFGQPKGGNGVERGGGNPYELEFVSSAREALAQLQDWQTENSSDQKIRHLLEAVGSLTELEAVIQRTQLHFTRSELLLEGAPKDAINEPGNGVIWIQEKAWEQKRLHPVTRSAFALHEYLGILRRPDAHYQISSLYMKLHESSLRRDAHETTPWKLRIESVVKLQFLSLRGDLPESVAWEYWGEIQTDLNQALKRSGISRTAGSRLKYLLHELETQFQILSSKRSLGIARSTIACEWEEVTAWHLARI